MHLPGPVLSSRHRFKIRGRRSGFTLIEVLVGALILASAGIVLTRALASIAVTDAAAMRVLGEAETLCDQLNRMDLELAWKPFEPRPDFFDRDEPHRERPDWIIRTRCRATARDAERLWAVQATLPSGRWKIPLTIWHYRYPIPEPEEKP